MNIQDAMAQFAKYNCLNLDNYVSSDYQEIEDEQVDNYIGKDIFEPNIRRWSNTFDEDDRETMFRLLGHYRYYSHNRIIKAVRYITGEISQRTRDAGILWEQVYFVTFPSKDGKKSGGDDMRSFLSFVNLGKISKGNIISDSRKNMTWLRHNAKAVVFLDDIAGSGATLYGNIKQFAEMLDEETHGPVKFYLAVIAERTGVVSEKQKALKKAGIDVETVIYEQLRQCFDGNYIFPEPENKNAKELVRKYEKQIDKADEQGKQRHVLGFHRSQLLLSFRYNTPNNTLCSFWEPSKSHFPLFIRSGYRRPSLDHLKKSKENNQKNAYYLGRVQNSAESE